MAGRTNKQEQKRPRKGPKIILKIDPKKKFTEYEQALISLNLSTLETRRDQLCLRCAGSCRKMRKQNTYFHTHNYALRKISTYMVQNSSIERLSKSPVIYMQNLLNKNHMTQKTQDDLHT